MDISMSLELFDPESWNLAHMLREINLANHGYFWPHVGAVGQEKLFMQASWAYCLTLDILC